MNEFGQAKQLLATLTTTGISVCCVLGRGYDGAAALSGRENGVQKHILEKCPTATHLTFFEFLLNEGRLGDRYKKKQ